MLARPEGRMLPTGVRVNDRLAELAERFGLRVPGDVPAGQLSVGEQQRLELIRALDADAADRLEAGLNASLRDGQLPADTETTEPSDLTDDRSANDNFKRDQSSHYSG